MTNFKRELILSTSADIQKFVLDRHGVELDELDIAELINYGLGVYLVDEIDGEME
jgi:hypothetical protein